MPGRRIDGGAIARRVEERVRAEVADLRRATAATAQLDAVLVGDDAASRIYVQRKEEACGRVGIATKTHRLPADTPADELRSLLDGLNRDPMVNGILVQLPLPGGLDAAPVVLALDPAKDIDCFHPENLGRALQGTGRLRPPTPQAVLTILDEERVPLEGADVVVVNHSNLVGRPLAALLLERNATVTVCHKYTRDLAAQTRRADVLVTATGVAGLITARHVKPGAVVVDVGIARDGGKVRGDVQFDEVLAVAAALTPVPGGVGPLTVAMLLRNVVEAFRVQHRLEGPSR